MPISRDFEPERPLQFRLVVDFDENVHAERKRRRLEFGGAASSTAAMMMRMQSAPAARASATW